jgi:hypothetical protein
MSQTVILHGNSQRSFAKQLIDRAPAGAVVTIREAKRTNEQNALMWCLLSDLSRAKPEGRLHTLILVKEIGMGTATRTGARRHAGNPLVLLQEHNAPL